MEAAKGLTAEQVAEAVRVCVCECRMHGIRYIGCTDSSVVKDRLSDAGGPRFESHAGRVTGNPTPKPLEG